MIPPADAGDVLSPSPDRYYADRHADLTTHARKRCLREATAAYEAHGPAACAAVLRRAWALRDDVSWNLLLTLDSKRTSAMALRDAWHDGWWLYRHIPVGIRRLHHDHAKTVAYAHRVHVWRSWRESVAAWAWHRSWSLSGRRGHLVCDGLPVSRDQLRVSVRSLWPVTDPELQPTEREVEEVVSRLAAVAACKSGIPVSEWARYVVDPVTEVDAYHAVPTPLLHELAHVDSVQLAARIGRVLEEAGWRRRSGAASVKCQLVAPEEE